MEHDDLTMADVPWGDLQGVPKPASETQCPSCLRDHGFHFSWCPKAAEQIETEYVIVDANGVELYATYDPEFAKVFAKECPDPRPIKVYAVDLDLDLGEVRTLIRTVS